MNLKVVELSSAILINFLWSWRDARVLQAFGDLNAVLSDNSNLLTINSTWKACYPTLFTRIYSKKKDEDYLFGSHSMAKQSIKHGRLTSVKIPSMQIHVAPPISLNEASRRDSSDIGEQTQGR
ncbi:Solute carrier family 12 member [Trichinella spiralis]|uniref:Solute carrier family 12 member n=1 Tax=Trichinella spiralis TaxID=6334 RepID=A0ABR3KTD1_TRISP